MKDILTAPFMTGMIRTAAEMYAHGWDERNGGNISLLLDEQELEGYLDTRNVVRTILTGFEVPELDGRYLLVTGTGTYFKNMQYQPEKDLGLIRLSSGGKIAELLWGWSDGGRFTSEFAAHLMSHAVRLKADPQHRVVVHCHPTNILAMTFVHSLDEREFTHTLWQMITECVMVFPDGIGVMPWMLCGTSKIGEATAEKMKQFRLVVWAQHGIYGTGRSLDEAFGLIETAEKAAEVYLKTAHLPRLNTITDDQLRLTAGFFGVTLHEGWL